MPDPQLVPIGGNVKLAVRRDGQGPIPLVFAHGYSLSSETWNKALPYFPKDRFTLIRYDQRGFGMSSHPASGFNMHQHALDLVKLLDVLDISKAVLIGHSLGGTISQECAILAPERMLGYISNNALARFETMPGIDAAKQARADAFVNEDDIRLTLRAAVSRYLDPVNTTDEDIESLLTITLQASRTALRDQLLDAYDARPLDKAAYASLSLPVLALTGSRDYIAPPAQAIAIAEVVPDSELSIIPRCGHSPMWERPGEWSRIVIDFLNRRIVTH